MIPVAHVEDCEITYLPAEEDPHPFLRWLDKQPGELLGFDVETGGPDPLNPFVAGFEVRLISFANRREAWAVHASHRDTIRTALAADHVFVAHNATFDAMAARRHFGVTPAHVIDTFLQSLLVFPPASEPDVDDELVLEDHYRLKPLSGQTGSQALVEADTALHDWFAELEPRPRGGEQSGAVRDWEGRCYASAPVDDERYWVYNGLDSIFCLRVLGWLMASWAGAPDSLRRVLANESELGNVLAGVTWRGLRVDRTALGVLFKAAVDAQQAMLPAFAELGVTNPNSTQQMSAALTAHEVYRPVFSESGQVSTDKMAGMLRLLDPDQPDAVRRLAVLLQTYRDHGKLRSKTREISALVTAGDRERVHPQLNALKARTGRMSINRPALQNLPKKDPRIRAAFLAEEGYALVGADFSQVEFRVAAALAEDEAMIAAIVAGHDLHDFTAAQIFGPEFTEHQRGQAKNVGFCVQYGGGPGRVARMTGLSEADSAALIDRFFGLYPQLRSYITRISRETQVVLPSGRRAAVDPDRTYANLNYFVQGTARDLFADALLRLRRAGWGAYLWLVIHDEIILQVPIGREADACAALEAAMNTTFLGVPITAKAKVLGPRWGQLEKSVA